MGRQKKVIKWLKTLKPDYVVLSGGNDIGQFTRRDVTEKILLEYCQNEKIPVLGICRGFQFMALASGAKLKKIKNHCRTIHRLKSGGLVNSFHKWSIDRCPKDYVVNQETLDGALEGIVHKTLPWHAVMWHPERSGNKGIKISF
jgi:putative glutamine amidotransferase